MIWHGSSICAFQYMYYKYYMNIHCTYISRCMYAQSYTCIYFIYLSRLYILQIDIQFLKYLLQDVIFQNLWLLAWEQHMAFLKSSSERAENPFFRFYCQEPFWGNKSRITNPFSWDAEQEKNRWELMNSFSIYSESSELAEW